MTTRLPPIRPRYTTFYVRYLAHHSLDDNLQSFIHRAGGRRCTIDASEETLPAVPQLGTAYANGDAQVQWALRIFDNFYLAHIFVRLDRRLKF